MIAFAFVPPVNTNSPLFVIPIVVSTSFAFVVKLFPLFTVTVLCLTLALFVTVPSITNSPVPVILFVFVPLVNATIPSFVIPFVETTVSASVINVPSSSTFIFC